MDKIIISEKELAKVQDNTLNKAQLNLLLGGTPKSAIYKRPAKGGGEWQYVTGTYMKKVLNLMFGWDWSFEVIEYKFDLQIKQAFVLGKLTCNSNGKSIIKMQFGRQDIKFKTAWKDGKKFPTDQPLDLGNDLKAATTDALKKCASELGIASDVYNSAEFQAIKVVGEDELEAEQVKRIRAILSNDKYPLTEEERMNIERVLDEQETTSYSKIVNLYR